MKNFFSKKKKNEPFRVTADGLANVVLEKTRGVQIDEVEMSYDELMEVLDSCDLYLCQQEEEKLNENQKSVLKKIDKDLCLGADYKTALCDFLKMVLTESSDRKITYREFHFYRQIIQWIKDAAFVDRSIDFDEIFYDLRSEAKNYEP